MARRRIRLLSVAGCGTVPPAIVGRAEMRSPLRTRRGTFTLAAGSMLASISPLRGLLGMQHGFAAASGWRTDQ